MLHSAVLASWSALLLGSVGNAAAQARVWVVGPASDRGAVWTSGLNPDASPWNPREIGDGEANLHIGVRDGFGAAVAALGDLNGDAVLDLAVGAPGDDHGGSNRGAVWILFRAADGSVAAAQPIRTGAGGWTGTLADEDAFGSALASVGDLDGDGNADLAVGAPGGGGGSVWILLLRGDGTVRSAERIGAGTGGFQGTLADGDRFGSSLAGLGDLDGDGRAELAVGAPGDDGRSADGGALYILSLDPGGRVHSQRKISQITGGFRGVPEELGSSVALAGDVDRDGVLDLAVGASGTDQGIAEDDTGAIWILFLRSDGTVRGGQQISGSGLGGRLPYARFGQALAPMGDIDGDSVPDLAVGAPQGFLGAVFLLFLNANGTARSSLRLLEPPGSRLGDALGSSLASLGDLERDGRPDIAIGGSGRDDLFAPTSGARSVPPPTATSFSWEAGATASS